MQLFVVYFRISVLHKKAFIFVRHSSRKSLSVLIGTSLKFRASIDILARDLSTDPPLPTEERPIKKCNGSSTWLVFSVQLTSRSSACSVCYFFFFFPWHGCTPAQHLLVETRYTHSKVVVSHDTFH